MGQNEVIFFTISNGGRHGEILSQKLFSVYMDDLSNFYIRSGIGCFLDKVYFNHVFYKNDLSLMVPYAIALQELLNIIGVMNAVIIEFKYLLTRSVNL